MMTLAKFFSPIIINLSKTVSRAFYDLRTINSPVLKPAILWNIILKTNKKTKELLNGETMGFFFKLVAFSSYKKWKKM